jgi:hypothetical protein
MFKPACAPMILAVTIMDGFTRRRLMPIKLIMLTSAPDM